MSPRLGLGDPPTLPVLLVSLGIYYISRYFIWQIFLFQVVNDQTACLYRGVQILHRCALQTGLYI